MHETIVQKHQAKIARHEVKLPANGVNMAYQQKQLVGLNKELSADKKDLQTLRIRAMADTIRNDTKLRTFNVKTVKYGTETIRFRGPKIWELVPEAIKFSQSLEEFKIKIKQWKPIGCTCKLCKQYIPNLGYL